VRQRSLIDLFAAAWLCVGLLGLGANSLAAGAQKKIAAVDDARLANAQNEPQNWLIYGGSWAEQRFSKLNQINVDTIAQLKPAWSVDFDTNRGQESTPLVVDGVMFVTTAWSKVYALDAKSGKQIWYYDPQVPGAAGVPMCCDVVNRGVAIYKGKVYVGTVDGRLVALDAATGKPVWTAMTVEPNKVYTITGAPRVARGKVFIGNAGADFGGRGYVSAYDAETGKLVWRFYTVPGDPAAKPDGAASDEVLAKTALPTWFGQWYKYGGGGHVWNSLVFDPDFKQVYMATGNGLPWHYYHRSEGKGDNLFIASVVAVDADTGRYKWHYQETPGDAWDYDSVADMTLADLSINGQVRKVLIHPPKNGFMYVLDRKTGKVISAEPFVPGVNWATHVDIATGRPAINAAALYKDQPWTGVPGGGGAHNWQPTAFSPQTNLLYLAASEGSTYYAPLKDFTYVEGMSNLGVDFAAMLRGIGVHGAESAGGEAPKVQADKQPSQKSYLLAWNPSTQKAAWTADTRGGGVLATAGNLVFQGRSRQGVLGEFVAYRADNGQQVWSYPTPNAISPGPVTYSVDGEQYVAVSSGASMLNPGLPARARQNGRVVVFKLNGTAVLPPEPPLAPPANPPQQVATAAAAAEGENHYNKYCARCHGGSAQNGNILPDLRRSPMLTSAEAWQSVVIDGVLTPRGMISWSRFLTPQNAEAVRAYVGEQARKLQQEERAAAH
jgi:quinohemoprotein ethanol dehydrogenase